MRHDRIDPAPSSTSPPTDEWQPDVIGKAHVDTGDADAVVRERTERSAAVAAGDPWLDLKSRFVDDPAGAVADAERLVQQAVDERIRELRDEVAAVFRLEDDDASTEALRNRLIRYQAYCQRLAGRALH
jgi:hypothetical protein